MNLRQAARALVRSSVRGALAAPLAALALVGGSGPDANTADSPWAGVGSLSVGGNLFTGTLIAPNYILTAAHVAANADPSTISFQLNAGSSRVMAASQVFVSPAYTGTPSGNVGGDPTPHTDLAIIRLATAAPVGVPIYSLYKGNLQGRDLNFVSYADSATTKRIGENIADLLFADTNGVAQTYLFDYDGPDLSTNRIGPNVKPNGTLGANREASIVSGDSGSSAFVNVNGQWQLAGINTLSVLFGQGPDTPGAYGTGGAGIVLSAHAAWINSVLLAPVPEPQTWRMLLLGMGILGAAAWRRRAAT